MPRRDTTAGWRAHRSVPQERGQSSGCCPLGERWGELRYHAGFADGYAHAREQAKDALREMMTEPREVRRRHRSVDLARSFEVKARRDAASRGELRTGPDYPGGPVDWETGRPARRSA